MFQFVESTLEVNWTVQQLRGYFQSEIGIGFYMN